MDRPSPHKREDQRLITRRQQGDLGEVSAMEWLTRHGAAVWTPVGHSPDADLIAELDGRLLRVQVKTSTYRISTPDGHERWSVALSTNGGNQSWSGVAKTFDPSRFDLLYALVGDGRRWLLPANAIESSTGVNLGGLRYSEFELEPTSPIDELIYGEPKPPLEFQSPQGEYPSGQRKQPVKLWADAFAGSNPASPISIERSSAEAGDTTRYECRRGRSGQSLVRPKRQLTMPKRPFLEAGLSVGDRLRVRAEGDGRVVFERIDKSGAGDFDS